MNKIQIFLSVLLYAVTCSIAAKFNLFIFFYILGFLSWLYILQGEDNRHSKFSWLLILLINPLVGMLLYNMLGKNYRSGINSKSKDTNTEYNNPADISEEFNLLAKLGKQQIHQNTNIDFLKDGETKFSQLIKDLEEANESILIEYYIIEDSIIFNKLSEILIKKANEGVSVKILIDALGSSTFPKKLITKLRANKIEIEFFGQARIPIINNKINFRNHRKIVVIDGEVAYCGGINIADRYIHGNEKMKTWHDTHLRIKGDLINDLLNTFISDWYSVTNTHLNIKTKEHEIRNNHLCQVIASGPDHKSVSLRNVYFKLITNAKSKIVITSPYFICDDELLLALTTASESGVDVSIILPGIPEGHLVGKYTRMNYSLLLRSGINIYETKDSFIHAKTLYIDDKLASSGTVNFDYRSFFLNYEISVFYNAPDTLASLNEQLNFYISNSHPIKTKEFKHGVVTRITDAIIRPFESLF